ncbi:MAG TPA: phasin family protein [Burkholderiaceae bacterium]|jgi:hypothetical protein|nr:phasin family protein [Burkholderiaceae bacterium]
MAATSRTASRKGTRRAESPETTVAAEESGAHQGTSSRAHRAESRESHAVSPMFDAMLEQVLLGTHKECAQAFIAACQTMLRNAHAIREAQLETNVRAQEAHEQAAAQLESARTLPEVFGVPASLIQSNAAGSFQHWSHLAVLMQQMQIERAGDALSSLARIQRAAFESMLQLLRVQASMPTSPEVMEAEVEHVTSPLTASPMVWPAQEASRQAMSMASTAWNDWVDWSTHWAEAANGNATSRVHH